MKLLVLTQVLLKSILYTAFNRGGLYEVEKEVNKRYKKVYPDTHIDKKLGLNIMRLQMEKKW